MKLSILSSKTSLILYVAFSIVFLSCGKKGGDEENSPIIEEESFEFVDIPVSFSQGSGLGLAGQKRHGLQLAEADEATSFIMKLEGCRSGLTSTITTSTFRVYQGDRDCLVKLLSFSFLGQTYRPSNELNFSTWLTEDLSKFENVLDANDIFYVEVISQLNQEQATSQDSVAYMFYQAKSGEGYTADIGQTNEATVSGYSAPNYRFSTNKNPIETGSIAPVVFNGINENGGGRFIFNFYCKHPMADDKCKLNELDPGVPLADIEYKLIDDSYGVETGQTIDIRELDEIMSSGTYKVNLNTDKLLDNNKGFKTVQLDGPDQIHFNSEMIFVIKNHKSYTYFGIKVVLIPEDQLGSFESCNKDKTCLSKLVLEKCTNLPKKSYTYDLTIEDTFSCNWGQDGNLNKKNGYVTARKSRSASIELPENAVLCKINEIKSTEDVFYDDWMVLHWNHRLIMSSIYNLVTHLEKEDEYYIYDWDKIKGKNPGVYEGFFCFLDNSCSIPRHAQVSSLNARFTEQSTRNLAVSLLMDDSHTKHELTSITYGDDDSKDCQMRKKSGGDINLKVDLEYVIDDKANGK